MKSKREERGKSMEWEHTNFLLQLDPLKTNKFSRKQPTSKQTFYLDTKIRRMNAADLIRKSDMSQLQRKLLLQQKKADENTDTQQYLYQLKKGYDELVKLSSRKQKQATQMKQTIDVIKVKIKGESEESGGHRKYLEEMERRMEELKMKQESTTMTSKNLEHMLDRMKKDDIVNQMRVNELENKVKVLEAHIVDTREQNMSLSEFGALSTIAVKTVEDGYLEAKEQRRRDMTHFENIMFRRTLADERTEERQRITEDIQAMAASDLNDSEIVKWKKLFMVQKFLKKLLKQKIANIEEKYSDVKNAFYTIKLKTNVTDPAGLISNFFNLEETYQKLLENVRNMENKTSVLEKTSKGLDREFEETKAEILLLTANRDSKVGSDLQREAEDVMEKSCQSQLIEDRIYFWLINTMYKLDSASDKLIGSKQKYYSQYPKEKLAEYLTQFLGKLADNIQAEGSEDISKSYVPYNLLKNLQATTNRLVTEQPESQTQKQQQTRKDKGKKGTWKPQL